MIGVSDIDATLGINTSRKRFIYVPFSRSCRDVFGTFIRYQATSHKKLLTYSSIILKTSIQFHQVKPQRSLCEKTTALRMKKAYISTLRFLCFN